MRTLSRLLSLSLFTLAAGCGGDDATATKAPGGGRAAAGKAGAAGDSASAGGTANGGKSGGAGQTAGGASAQGGASAGNAGNNAMAGAAGASGSAGQAGAAAGGAGGSAGASGQSSGGQSAAGQSAGGQSSGGQSAGGQSAGGQSAGGQSAGGAAGAGGVSPCGGCVGSFVCKHATCVPDLGTCASNGDCPGDSYCDADKTCVPYGVPATKINDDSCKKAQVPGTVTPQVQCEWSGPPAGDATAKMTEIYSVPIVADLNLDLDPNKLQPSVIVTTFDFNQAGRTGMLRVFDGRTCEEQMRIGGPDDPNVDANRPGYAVTWAVGDLDGDVGTPNGHPEIVGFHRVGLAGNYDPLVPVAFSVNTSVPGKPKLVKKWEGRDCSNGKAVPVWANLGNLAISLKDLDNDGKPEVLSDFFVFDYQGCLLNKTVPALNNGIGELGVISTYADVDLDGRPELVRYDGIWAWDSTGREWVRPTWAKASADLTAAYTAIADFGAFSTINGISKDLPEIVVIANGKARVQTIGGDVVFGPFDVFDGGRGGPPTAADFDGDGQVEFATAGSKAYTVYDPDCAPGADSTKRPGGVCTQKAGSPPGVLWTQPSQDASSNVTGSSVFDFDGDGTAEVVYRDECYLRVYKGATGEVIYSAPASSGTGVEYPVIVDVDGDFATEIVVTRTSTGACPAVDPLNPNSGAFKQGTGFVILRDPEDRWASSRPIWNQHDYYVTNISDNGQVPKSAEEKHNWTEKGLNNFRTNVQGGVGGLLLADLTVEIQNTFSLCDAVGETTVTARVCNRGTNPVQDGAKVSFGKVFGGVTTPLCDATTNTLLAVGACTEVSCKGDLSAGGDVIVTVDPEAKIADCHPGNNKGASARVLCGKDLSVGASARRRRAILPWRRRRTGC